ncbi:uncharacterized protein [Spinacia oleracea]|uniref:Retrotransposon gag domain-containing protein n=1 Tax=Spinacia oleracea TaxID=3562 RepID=A0ABM3RRZ3_SPIOL|nr:uncharacterized protein LOC130472003 [Spinacia oleracea]
MVIQSNLPLYQGESDPSVLENWLRKFDKLMVVVNCPENLRDNSVVYYLRGEADLWWKRCENALRATPRFGWESFKDALSTKKAAHLCGLQVRKNMIESETGKKGERMLETRVIEIPIVIATGSIVKCTETHRNVPLTIAKTIFLSNLIEFELGELDVILSMDWLAMFKAKTDCEERKGSFEIYLR